MCAEEISDVSLKDAGMSRLSLEIKSIAEKKKMSNFINTRSFGVELQVFQKRKKLAFLS